MSQINKIPTLYNPANQSKEEINESFVIREKELNIILSDVKKDNMKYPPQHFLIQGIRGTGKTTLLLKLYYTIKDDENLNKWLYPVMFHEEQYNITKLYKLWTSIIEKLEYDEKKDEFIGITEKANELISSDNCEQNCFKLLIDNLIKNNKKIILLMDNFTELLGKFKLQEQQRLREVLITCNSIRIVGCSTLTLEYYFDYKAPFYEFFKIIQLKGLDKVDTIKLLLRLGEVYGNDSIKKIIEEKSEKINALRILTGGIPRTIVLLFEIFVDDINGDATKNLENIIDRVTPLYKDRMDKLPVQQQEIIHILALNWDAIPVKDVVKKMHTESKIISAQFNQLEKNGIIEKKKTSTKNHLYQITERFFNIWYLMRFGGKRNEEKVIWLVRFLETCFDKTDLIKRAEKLINSIKEGNVYEKHAFYLTSALFKTKIPHQLKDKLVDTAKSYLSEKNPEFVKELPRTYKENINKAIELLDKDKFNEALNILLSIEKQSIEVVHLISTAYYYLKEYEKAKKFCLKGVKLGNKVAMFNLALLFYEEFDDYKNAEKYYLMAVKKGYISAINNLALIYEINLKDSKKAEKYFLLAIEKGSYGAMNNLALLYEKEYKDFIKAEKYYLMAIEKGNIKAMNNLAQLYESVYGDNLKTERYYLMAIKKGNEEALINLSLLYLVGFKDLEKAKKYFLLAYEKGFDIALLFLSLIDFQNSNLLESQKYYKKLLEKNEISNYIVNMAYLTAKRLLLKTDLLKLSEYMFEKNNEPKYLLFYSFILLSNDKFDELFKISKENLEKIELMKENFESYAMYLILLLSKKQINYVNNLFEKFSVAKDMFKAIYFALMKLMEKEYPDEYKKMGSELDEPVNRTLELIKEYEKIFS